MLVPKKKEFRAYTSNVFICIGGRLLIELYIFGDSGIVATNNQLLIIINGEMCGIFDRTQENIEQLLEAFAEDAMPLSKNA